MKNYILRYGLIGGSVSIVLGLLNWFLLAKSYGPSVSQAFGYVGIVLAFVCIPMGIKYFRDKLNQGTVSFGQGFKIGTGIALVASLMMALYSMLFFVFAGDDFKQWEKTGMSESQLQQLSEMPAYMNSTPVRGLMMFVMAFLIGMIINLVSALALKNTRKAVIIKS